MRLLTTGVITIGFVGAIWLQSASAVAGEVAVIVNKANPTEEVSLEELGKIFRRDKKFWNNGRPIYLLLQETGSWEKQLVLRAVYRMNDETLKQFWLGKIFRGDIPSFPPTLESNRAVLRFVSQVPAAVGFIDALAADDTVRVLRINGKRPDEQGYPLQHPAD